MLAIKVYSFIVALFFVLWLILPSPIPVTDDKSLFAECDRQSGGAYKDILFKQCVQYQRQLMTSKKSR